MYYNGQVWMNVGSKVETTKDNLKLMICFSKQKFTLELFRNNPSRVEKSSEQPLASLLEFSRQCNFKANFKGYHKTIELITKQLTEIELRLLEKQNIKPMNTEGNIESLIAILSQEHREAEQKSTIINEMDKGFLQETPQSYMFYETKEGNEQSKSQDIKKDSPVRYSSYNFDSTWLNNISQELEELEEQETKRRAMEESQRSPISHLFNQGSRASTGVGHQNIHHEKKSVEVKKSSKPTPRKSGADCDGFSCAICYNNEAELRGKLECKHDFCFDCIIKWGEKSNSCPMCKREFFRVAKHNMKGEFIDTVDVQSNQINEEDLYEEDPRIANADDHCYACEETEDQDSMLVCDHCFTKCCHIYCLRPALDEVPFEPWYCDFCINQLNIRSTLPTANFFARGRRGQRRRQNLISSSNSRENSREASNRNGRSDRNLRGTNNRANNASNTSNNRRRLTNQSRNNMVAGRSRSNSSIENEDENNQERFVYDPNFVHEPRVQRQRRITHQSTNRAQPQPEIQPSLPPPSMSNSSNNITRRRGDSPIRNTTFRNSIYSLGNNMETPSYLQRMLGIVHDGVDSNWDDEFEPVRQRRQVRSFLPSIERS